MLDMKTGNLTSLLQFQKVALSLFPIADILNALYHRLQYARNEPVGFGSRGVGFSAAFVRLSVFSAQYLRNHAVRITKRDKQMFHDESWKPIYFGVKRSKVKVTSHRNIAGVGVCTLVSAGFLQFLQQLQM